ncbi:LysR family transcriptional regulator [Paralimibaculum aggregatum]|uniref:LysR family transcriptional regulator n=1 Tax=Paralimibaculum aggregatum TaxID=3036245 RepID=A0ABQ6LPE9_9RHOB|nr:LysR substrate-binding domain-containing protein [Limibaculum sp. NKW23]GMG84294.1 LysR family transcriptional regulator [Limibaculum sp. NKW23]
MRHLMVYDMIEAVHRAGSIRKAAEDTNITASALNRRIQAFEQEFGSEIFERLPRGMRLNPAGELLLHHIRSQRQDLARIHSQVADLSGVRRGHVKIACSQALLPYFLPRQISIYRRDFPAVTFSVNVRDRIQAEQDLVNFESDIALVYEPAHMVDFEVLHVVAQPVLAVMSRAHPLAARRELRLRECLDYDLLLPGRQYGVRVLLDAAAHRIGRPLEPALETESFEMIRHCAAYGQAIGFQIPVGLNELARPDLAYVPLSGKDVAGGQLYLGHLRGRTLPVAALKFANQIAAALGDAA